MTQFGRKGFRLWLAFIFLPVFSLVLPRCALGAAISIPLPCVQASPSTATASPPPSSIYRSCDLYLNGAPAIPATPNFIGSPATPGILTVIYQRIQQQVDCAYQGIDLDPSKATSANQCAGDYFGQPCSLVALPFYGGNPETFSDHRGKSCPLDYAKLKVQATNCTDLNQTSPPSALLQIQNILTQPPYNVSQSQIASADAVSKMDPSQRQALYQKLQQNYPDLVSAAPTGMFNCIFANVSSLSAGKRAGDLERSWMRGAYLQALSYHTGKVLSEMSCTHQLTINTDPQLSACANFAADAQIQDKAIQKATASVAQLLSNQANISDIGFCKADWDQLATAARVDAGQLRQAAQHLCALRAYYENMIAQLAACDIFDKTRTDYKNHQLSNEADRQNFLVTHVLNDAKSGLLSKACSNQCKNSTSYDDATSCANSCYQANIIPILTQTFQSWWPLNQPNSCSEFGAPSLPSAQPFQFPPPSPAPSPLQSDANHWVGLGFAAGFLQVKRGIQWRKLLSSLFALLISWLIFGCSSSQNLPAMPALDPNNSTCPGGNPICCTSPSAAGCPTESAGLSAVTSALGAGAAYGGAAGANTEAGIAQTFSGGARANGTAQFSAATAGTAQISGDNGSSALPNSSVGSNLGNLFGFKLSPGQAPSGSSNGSGGGAKLEIGNTLTLPAAVAPVEDNSSNSSARNSATAGPQITQTTGSGSGKATPAVGDAAASSRSGETVSLAGHSPEQGFNPPHENTHSMIGVDPENYFTLIDIDRSLFKIVENRYRTTTASWIQNPTLPVPVKK